MSKKTGEKQDYDPLGSWKSIRSLTESFLETSFRTFVPYYEMI